MCFSVSCCKACGFGGEFYLERKLGLVVRVSYCTRCQGAIMGTGSETQRKQGVRYSASAPRQYSPECAFLPCRNPEVTGFLLGESLHKLHSPVMLERPMCCEFTPQFPLQ